MTYRTGPHTRNAPCPACDGYRELLPGRGVRCYGMVRKSGRTFICTRPERAGRAQYQDHSGGYLHFLFGACPCGVEHNPADRDVLRGGAWGSVSAPASASPERASAPAPAPEPDPDALTVEERDAMFRYLLELLPLRNEHAFYWRSRSPLDWQAAVTTPYGSLPVGTIATRTMVTAMAERFGWNRLARLPGFYEDRRSGRLTFHKAFGGYDACLIPATDELGRIIGMFRRTLSFSEGRPHAKYETLKGGGNEYYTVAGPLDWQAGEPRLLWITEGGHKARVAARVLPPRRVLGLPAAYLAPAHLDAIRRLQPTAVVAAWDADQHTKREVRDAQAGAIDELLTLGIPVYRAVWEEEAGKGLDDALISGGLVRLREVPRTVTPLARKPYPVPIPGDVPPGQPLTIVRAETAKVIERRIKERRQHHGEVLPIVSPPGVGKTFAVLDATRRFRVSARIVVGTRAKVREIVDDPANHGHVREVHPRSDNNCTQMPLVRAAQHHGFGRLVSQVICKDCPSKARCQVDGYYGQFRHAGTMVATTEFLTSGPFLEHGEVVILDDAEPERLIDRTDLVIRPDHNDLAKLADVVGPGATRDLLLVCQRAVRTLQEQHAEEAERTILVGGAAWDALARAAGTAARLAALIEATPPATDYLPSRDEDGELTVEAIKAAPKPALVTLLTTLRHELPAFRNGGDFNSRMSLSPGRLTLLTMATLPVNRKTERPILADRTVLILDATPNMSLYEAVFAGLAMAPPFQPQVTLPANVRTIQVADRFFGKATTKSTKGKQAALAALAAAMRTYAGDQVGVICAKALKPAVVELGIPEEKVLTFFGARGMNTLAGVDTLFVVGRPQAPDATALTLAQATHGCTSPPIIGHMTMRPAAYGGYRGPDGRGRAVDVVDFEDPRAAAVFQGRREDELLQAVHRARLFLVGDAQISMDEPEIAGIARQAQIRRAVRLVLITEQPIPGLRVDELVYDLTEAEGGRRHNARRAQDARTRILTARDQLVAAGQPVTITAVAQATGANKRTVATVLAQEAAKNDRGGSHGLYRSDLLTRVNRGDHFRGAEPLPPPRGEDPEGWAVSALAVGAAEPGRRRIAAGAPLAWPRAGPGPP